MPLPIDEDSLLPKKGALPTGALPVDPGSFADQTPAPAEGKGSYIGASARSAIPRFLQSTAELGALGLRTGLDVANLQSGGQVPEVEMAAAKQKVAAPVVRASNKLGEVADAQFKDLSPEAQATADKKYATLDQSKAAYRDPVRVTGDVIQQLPQFLLTIVEPALGARALAASGGKAAVADAAKSFAARSALAEGAVGYGQEASQARERAAKVQGTDGTDILSSKAAEQAGLTGGAVDAGASYLGGRVLGKVITEGGGMVARAVKGFAEQGAEEAVQGAGEQIGENKAIRDTVNPQQDLMQDVGENVASSAVIGGVMGGGAGAVLGRSGKEGNGFNAEAPTGDAGTTLQVSTPPLKNPATLPIQRGAQGDLFALDDVLDRGIAPVESGGRSGVTSEKGAEGKFQLLPATAKEVADRIGVPFDAARLKNDPEYGRELAKEHLRSLVQKYDGDMFLAVTAYNAGAGNVDSWVRRFGYDPSNQDAFLGQVRKVGNPRSAAYPQKVLASLGRTDFTGEAGNATAPSGQSPLGGAEPVDLETAFTQGSIAQQLRNSTLDDEGNALPLDPAMRALSLKLSKTLTAADPEAATAALKAQEAKIEKAVNELVEQQTALNEGKVQHTPEEHDAYQRELDGKLEDLIVKAKVLQTGHDVVARFVQAVNTPTQPSLFEQPAAPEPVPAAPVAAPAAPAPTLITEPERGAAFGRRPTLPAEPQPRIPIDASETELAQGLKTEAANTVSANAKARQAILDRVFGDPATRRPTARFTAELKRAGLETHITPEEAERISRYEDAREGFTDPNQPDLYRAPSAPDESGNFGIPERQERPVTPRAVAGPGIEETPSAPAPEAAAAIPENIHARAQAKADTLGSSRRAWFLRGADKELGLADNEEPRSKSKASWFNEGRQFVQEERAHQERERLAKEPKPEPAPKKTRAAQIKEKVAARKAEPAPEPKKTTTFSKPAVQERGGKKVFDTAVAEAEQKNEITSRDGMALRAAAEAAWDQSMWEALDTAKAEHSNKGTAKFRFEPKEGPGDTRVKFSELSPAQIETIRRALKKQLRAALDKLNLQDVELFIDTAVGIGMAYGVDPGRSVGGMFSSKENNGFSQLIEVAMDISNPRKTLHHEAIHAIRQLNLLTDKEWAALGKYASKGPINDWVQANYQDFSPEIQMEEAIAETFAQWHANRNAVPQSETLVQAVMRKLRAFFDAVRMVFTKAGFPDAKSVMQLIESGQVGLRERGMTRNEIALQDPEIAAEYEREKKERGLARVENFSPPVKKAAKGIRSTLLEGTKKGHVWLNFTEDLANMAKKYLPSAGKLVELHSRNFALSREFEERLLQIKEAYEKIPSSLRGTGKGTVNDFLYDSRMAGKWGFKPDYMPKAEVDPALQQRFNRMPKAAQDVIRSVFRFNYDARNQLYKATVSAIDAEYDPLIAAAKTPEQQKAMTAEKTRAQSHFSRVFDTKEGVPYTPLKREGSWVVIGKSEEYAEAKRQNDTKKMDELRSNPDHYFVDFRDTVAEADALRDNVATKFGKANSSAFERSGIPDGEIGGPELYIAFQQLKEAVEGEMKSKPGSKAAKELHRLATDLYLHTLSETSARKGEMAADLVPARDPVTGEVIDMMRAFVTRGQATTRYVASISNNSEMQAALRAMREELSATEGDARKPAARFYNELLWRYMTNLGSRPNRFVDNIARGVSFWNLLTSPFYYLQNATQAVLLSQPIIAGRVGYATSAKAFAQAYADFAAMTKDIAFTDRVDFAKAPSDVREMLKRLAERGRLDAGLANELGSWQMNGDGVLPATWNKVDRFFRQAPQRVEVMNRVVTGIAAYRSLLAKGASPDDAFEFASKVIYDSHGDYSGFNAPRPFAQLGNASKIVLQFRKFQVIMASMLAKEFHRAFKGEDANTRNAARLALFFTAAHMISIGGMIGLPGAAVFGMALNAALNALDPDDDKDFDDWQENLRKWLGAGDDGSWIANLMFKGAPYALLGADLSGKLGLGNVLSPAPYTDADKAFTGREEMYKTIGQILGGPLGGIAAKVSDGWAYASEGDLGRAAEMFVPGGAANMLKAKRLRDEGLTARNGDTLIGPDDISGMDEFLTAIGITPSKLANQQDRRSLAFEADEYYKTQTTRIKRRYLNADGDQRDKIKDEWDALQDARERDGFKRQPLSTLLKTEREQAKREKKVVGGVPTTKTDLGFVKELMDMEEAE